MVPDTPLKFWSILQQARCASDVFALLLEPNNKEEMYVSVKINIATSQRFLTIAHILQC